MPGYESETWRPIPSVAEYLASSDGRIMRVPYFKIMPRGGQYVRGGQPHHGTWDGTRFIHHYKKRTFKVHRLVCEAFHGPSPFAGAVVMHLNEDASDNRASNLAWGTQKENMNAVGYLAYCSKRVGDNNPLYKGIKRRVLADLGITKESASA